MAADGHGELAHAAPIDRVGRLVPEKEEGIEKHEQVPLSVLGDPLTLVDRDLEVGKRLFEGQRLLVADLGLLPVRMTLRFGVKIEPEVKHRSRAIWTDVIDALADLIIPRGMPDHTRSDNGPDFVARALQTEIVAAGAKTACIEPDCPRQNGHCESFKGKHRD